MVRPTKLRRIECEPVVSHFIPSEKGIEKAEENILLLEELEAIRLKDLEGFEQYQCAEKMEVSRPTFQRILLSAREKIADSIINGKAIHIQGGNYTKNICNVKCNFCNHKWNESFENLQQTKDGEYTCPTCKSTEISCLKQCKNKLCSKCSKTK